MHKVSGIVLQGNSRGLLSTLLLFFLVYTTISGIPAEAADGPADCRRRIARVVSIQGLVEVQGTAEGTPFSRKQLNALLDLAQSGIAQLMAAQRAVLGLER